MKSLEIEACRDGMYINLKKLFFYRYRYTNNLVEGYLDEIEATVQIISREVSVVAITTAHFLSSLEN